MSDPAWEEYLAAARRLDALRRGAATAEDDPGRVAVATLEELTRVRARLAAQHLKLRTLGVPQEELQPSPAEVAAADPRGRATGPPGGAGWPDGGGDRPYGANRHDGDDPLRPDGPGTVWASLRRSRALAEQADAAMSPPRGWAALRQWCRRVFRRSSAGRVSPG